MIWMKKKKIKWSVSEFFLIPSSKKRIEWNVKSLGYVVTVIIFYFVRSQSTRRKEQIHSTRVFATLSTGKIHTIVRKKPFACLLMSNLLYLLTKNLFLLQRFYVLYVTHLVQSQSKWNSSMRPSFQDTRSKRHTPSDIQVNIHTRVTWQDLLNTISLLKVYTKKNHHHHHHHHYSCFYKPFVHQHTLCMCICILHLQDGRWKSI